MKFDHVLINNWLPPGEEWWNHVKCKPNEPLIKATLNVTLSWNEYHRLLEEDTGVEITPDEP